MHSYRDVDINVFIMQDVESKNVPIISTIVRGGD